MHSFDNPMRRQVMSLPDLIHSQYLDLEPKTRIALSTTEIFAIQRIVLTGCGDSHASSMAMKYLFEYLTGIPTDVVSAMDLARFYSVSQLGFSPQNPLVIAVSNSGSIARVCEAIKCSVRHGAFALSITGNELSELAQNSSRTIPLDIPPFESAPGVRSYLVSVLSLLLLAIRIGEVRGRYSMDQAMLYRSDVIMQADLLTEVLPTIDNAIRELAESWKNLEAFDFIGCGADYAAAWYGHAKILEAAGLYAMYADTEEWLHLNFFLRRFDRIGTIIVCGSNNPGLSRARELSNYAVCNLKRPTVIITDGDAFDDLGTPRIRVPKSNFEHTGILTQFVPMALLAGYIAEMIGEEDGRGCKDNWSFCKDGASVRNSEYLIR